MTETKYTQEQIAELIAANDFLKKTEAERYAVYRKKDPFPKVGQALLNSVDLLLYILTVGIIEPFRVDYLKGETYECTFSGESHRYDTKLGKMVENHIKNNQELTLEPNSITYLKIEETFRVPEYMVLRFNLSVSNAYKGILLGTGPIVDSGFEGSIFIPLHNLTGNSYIIKKGAPLIRVEFTKLSTHDEWQQKDHTLKIVHKNLKPISKDTPKNAKFSIFFEKALLDTNNKLFYTGKNAVSVRSSIPDAIKQAASNAEDAHKNAIKSATIVLDLKNKLQRWSLLGGIGALIAVAALMISVFTLIQDTNTRYDSLNNEIKDYQFINSQYQETISDLQRRLTSLEIRDKQGKLELLKDEYTSIVSKNSESAKKINEQIVNLEKEIEKRQIEIVP